jgi:hypothetical protein
VIYATLILIGVVLLALTMAVGTVVSVFALPEGARYTEVERFSLLAAGFVAAVTALVVSPNGGWWWVIPVACYIAVLLGAKWFAVARRDHEADKQRRRLAASRRHAEQLDRERRDRADRLGKDGLRILDKLNLAISRIRETDAARDGWLGDIGDINFSLDLLQTEEQLAQITALRNKIREANQLGQLSSADVKLTKEATTAAQSLEVAVRERVTRIEECARKAREIDRALLAQRKEAADADQRDAIREQLAALLAAV